MKAQKMKKLGFAAIVAGLAIAMAAPAHATLTLRLSPSAGPAVTVVDGGVGDGSATVGVVMFSGVLAGWTVNVTTGLSKPVLAADPAHIDLNSVNVSGGAGSLMIELSDTDFSTASPVSFRMAIGGTTDGSVTYDAYADANNALFTNGTNIGTLGPFAPVAFSGSLTGGGPFADGSFSISQLVFITHANAQDVTSFNAELRAVPEPGSLALFGMSIFGLGLALRRRLGQKA